MSQAIHISIIYNGSFLFVLVGYALYAEHCEVFDVLILPTACAVIIFHTPFTSPDFLTSPAA